MCRKIGGISSIDFIYFCGKKAAPSTGTDWKEAHGRIRDAPEPESEASLMPNTARARETTEEWRFEKGPKKEDKTNLGNFWCVLVLSSACWGSRYYSRRIILLERICAWALAVRSFCAVVSSALKLQFGKFFWCGLYQVYCSLN